MNQARKAKLEFLNFEDEQTVIDTSPHAVISPVYQFFHSPYFPTTFINILANYFKEVRERMIESREQDKVLYADSAYQKTRRFISRVYQGMLSNLKS